MYTKALSLLALAGAAQAHMSIFYPPPLGGDPSINPQSTVVDKEFNYPLGCCGADGPTEPSPGLCRGHLDKFDTEEASVTWQAGGDAYFQLTDHNYDPNAPGSTHYGGSCQVGFSVDKGKTWKVAASYHGACPKHTEDGSPEAQTFDFKVPTGMPEGDAIFAWTWLNREHEAFMNCAKVKITGGSGNTTPSNPSTPAQSSTAPKPPAQSYGSQPSTPETPEGDEDAAPPAYTPRPSGRPSTPSYEDTEEDTESNDDAEDIEDSDSDSEGDWSKKPWWAYRPHREVKQGVRRYTVDGHSCECRREPGNSRCYCETTDSEKRAVIEKKALRVHRRTLYKRVDACDWNSAPAMEVSYYTSDAKCAPNAKILTPESDNFELGWDVSCGKVEGDGEYEIRMMECSMYGA